MSLRILLGFAASALLAACHQQAQNAAGTNAHAVAAGPVDSRNAPAPSAPAVVPATPLAQPSARPTIALANGTTTVTVSPAPTPCGAEKLFNYLNLLPTSTAKDEIARTLGHHNIRYVPLGPSSNGSASKRVTAELGVDGRIKKFSCG